MKNVFAVVLLSAGLLMAKETGLVVRKDMKWPSGLLGGEVNLKVCWQEPGDQVQIKDEVLGGDLGVHDVRFIKTAIKDAVKGTWEKYAGINFEFVEGGSHTCHVQIHLAEIMRDNATVGYVKSGGVVTMNPLMLKYIYETKGTSSVIQRKNEPWVQARAQFALSGTLNSILIKQVKWTAVHEFGHIIGLWHEQARKEASGAGEKELESSRDLIGVVPEKQQQQPVAYYDRYSVMNYNNSNYGITKVGTQWIYFMRDRDGNDVPANPQLSCGDVIAARKLYTPSASKAGIAPCCTEESYKSLMTDPGIISSPYPTYAAFYQRNLSCFQQGGIRTGGGPLESCVSLAKAAAGSDVCKFPADPVNSVDPVDGELIKDGCNYDVVATDGEVPDFESEVSLFMKGTLPHYRIKVTMPNLQWIKDRALTEFWMFKVRRAGKKTFEYPPTGGLVLKPNCGFNAVQGLSQCTIEIPMGAGDYMGSKDCFCSRNSTPQEGDYVMYDPQEDTYLVDNSFVEFQAEYIIQDGKTTRMYKMATDWPSCQRYRVEQTSSSPLKGYVSVPLDIGDQFRVGSAWLTGTNRPPNPPGAPGVTASDNGSGALAVSWSPVVDPDGDPVYYFVEVKDVNAGTFKKYKALQSNSLSITGLKRYTNYLVRVSAFDSRVHAYGEYSSIQTLDRPEICSQASTEKVVLGGFPAEMLREGISLASRRVGASDTYFWDYPSMFCSEHSPYGLTFIDIPVAAGAVPTDWLFVEADKYVNVYLHFQEGTGPEGQVAPGLFLNNDYSYASGNFIKLGDYWGEGAKHFGFTQWRAAQKLTKIRVVLKTNPPGRTTSRFGRALLFKESPFGLNYKGLRINDEVYADNVVRHPVYIGEPVEVDLNLWTDHMSFEGSFLGSFKAVGGTRKKYALSSTLVQGDNVFSFTVVNSRYNFERQPLQIILQATPNPYLAGVLHADGRLAKGLLPNKQYRLNIGDVAKPIRTISLLFNGEPAGLVYTKHSYRFTTPSRLLASNELSLTIDGVKCTVVKMKPETIMSVLMLLFQ